VFLQAALGVVARMLHAQPRGFGFAGTKDKRGVTTQWVTAFKVAPAKLAALNPRCDAWLLLLLQLQLLLFSASWHECWQDLRVLSARSL
jgi:hypothetical protein